MGQSMALLTEDPSMGQTMVQFMVAQIMVLVQIMAGTHLREDFQLPALITHLQVTFPLNPAIPFHPHLAVWDDMD